MEEITVEDTQDFHEEFGELGYSIDEADMFRSRIQRAKSKTKQAQCVVMLKSLKYMLRTKKVM